MVCVCVCVRGRKGLRKKSHTPKTVDLQKIQSEFLQKYVLMSRLLLEEIKRCLFRLVRLSV